MSNSRYLNARESLAKLNITVPLFRTDIDQESLFIAYLKGFKPEEMWEYNCNACRHFITKYAGLVAVNDRGLRWAPLWPFEDAPEGLFTAKITSRFYTDGAMGTYESGGYYHLCAAARPPNLCGDPARRMAESKEEYKHFRQTLHAYTPTQVERALSLLPKGVPLNIKAQLEWFLEVQRKLKALKGQQRTDLAWLLLAEAPHGFAMIGSTLAGQYLTDLKTAPDNPYQSGHANRAVEKLKERSGGLVYQRPKAPPKSGNIDQAEKIMAGLGDSLNRREASFSEVSRYCYWAQPVYSTSYAPYASRSDPSVVLSQVSDYLAEQHREIFSGLRTPKKPIHSFVQTTMTWVKFMREILPQAREITFVAPSTKAPFITITNGPEPSLFKWPNTFCWYYRHGGAMPVDYNIGFASSYSTRRQARVLGISDLPSNWSTGDWSQFPRTAVLYLEGAHDLQMSGLALFPETLKREFYEIRSTIEAFSNNRILIQTPGGQRAAGIAISGELGWKCQLEVKLPGDVIKTFIIDRYE